MLILIAAGSFVDGFIGKRMALASFDEKVSGAPSPAQPHGADAPVAVLEIARLGVEVPVFEGTGKAALRRGAGSIEGTAVPGQQGNIGIAGHRDGFFRPLEDIREGDLVQLVSRTRIQRFRVSEIRIVDALDVSVLEDNAGPRLTLVTCFPFRYVGFAPDRFIVHATLEAEAMHDEPDESHDAVFAPEAADHINQENSL